MQVQSLVGIPYSRKWQSIPVFLLGESHAQKSLVCSNPLGQTQLKQLGTHTAKFLYLCMSTIYVMQHIKYIYIVLL